MSMRIGLISDTHGTLRPGVLRVFAGVDLIVHAGDVGGVSVLDALRALAPVEAVFGNVDLPDGTLPASIDREIEGVSIHVSHGHEVGRPDPDRLAARYHARVIVFGHTHRAIVQPVRASLVINPGAAGPARFDLKPSVAVMTFPALDVQIVQL